MSELRLIYFKKTTCPYCIKFDQTQIFPNLEKSLANKTQYPIDIITIDENNKDLYSEELKLFQSYSNRVPTLLVFFGKSTESSNSLSGSSIVPENNSLSGSSIVPGSSSSSNNSQVKFDIIKIYKNKEEYFPENIILDNIKAKMVSIKSPTHENPKPLNSHKLKYIKYKYKYLELKNKYLH